MEHINTSLTDNYEHISAEITYIKQNIPCAIDLNDPETIEIQDKFNYVFSEGCSCSQLECSIENQCPCILKFGLNYEKNTNQDGTYYILNKNNIDKPHFECGAYCGCPDYCGNRLVQHGPTGNLSIVPTLTGKGYGLKTNQDLRKFSFVCEYAGEILSTNMAKQRYQQNKINGAMNYIFCLNEITGRKIIKTYVDPSEFGNIGRYLNHSCRPNCFIVPIRVDINIPKLCIFTVRDILKGEELTFDYGANERVGGEKQNGGETDVQRTPCLCGEKDECRKWLPCDLEEM